MVFRNLLLVGALTLASMSSAFALPFNKDMTDVQMRTGSIMRPKAPGSVPMGSAEAKLRKTDDFTNLENPLKGDKNSAARGASLYRVNCTPCHGDISKVPYVKGPVALVPGSLMVAAPNLVDPTYVTGRTDGQIYKYIHFSGDAIMPAYGWKLSPTEHWDIVNYIRKVQVEVAKK